LDFLENISSLVEELSGVHDLFNEPYNGFKQDDLLLFTTDILKGGKNFTTYFLKGITNTVSKKIVFEKSNFILRII
ncbi:Vacuolar protein sorting-associated protein, partial [Pseudoloma neurophilia]